MRLVIVKPVTCLFKSVHSVSILAKILGIHTSLKALIYHFDITEMLNIFV